MLSDSPDEIIVFISIDLWTVINLNCRERLFRINVRLILNYYIATFTWYREGQRTRFTSFVIYDENSYLYYHSNLCVVIIIIII